ncbi:hypothetical protein GCM10027046_17980 [Uliginosibacterium flavum]
MDLYGQGVCTGMLDASLRTGMLAGRCCRKYGERQTADADFVWRRQLFQLCAAARVE